jgi:hypothetical protein
MTRKTRCIQVMAMVFTLAGCNESGERVLPLGQTCQEGRCFVVSAIREFRTKSIWEGESSETITGTRILVSETSRSGDVRRKYPELICLDVSCIDRRIELLNCGTYVLPVQHAELFAVGSTNASDLSCDQSYSIGSYPQPI